MSLFQSWVLLAGKLTRVYSRDLDDASGRGNSRLTYDSREQSRAEIGPKPLDQVRKDLRDGFGRVELPYALARKYPNANRVCENTMFVVRPSGGSS